MFLHMVRLPVEEMIFRDLFYVWTSKVIITLDFLLNHNLCKSLNTRSAKKRTKTPSQTHACAMKCAFELTCADVVAVDDCDVS